MKPALAKCFRISLPAINAMALLLVGLFWVRSYLYGDDLLYHHSPRHVEATSYKGVLSISLGTLSAGKYAPERGWTASFWPIGEVHPIMAPHLLDQGIAGFHAGRLRRVQDEFQADLIAVQMPWWFIALVALTPMLLFARTMARDRRATARRRKGQCPSCGYDLRATPDRCPECGGRPATTFN